MSSDFFPRFQRGEFLGGLLNGLGRAEQLVLRDQHRVVGVHPVLALQHLGGLREDGDALRDLARDVGEVVLGLGGGLVEDVHHELQQLPELHRHVVPRLQRLLPQLVCLRSVGRGLETYSLNLLNLGYF